MRIYTLDNEEPHADYDGWEGFLSTCEKRDEACGVIFYGKVNSDTLLGLKPRRFLVKQQNNRNYLRCFVGFPTEGYQCSLH